MIPFVFNSDQTYVLEFGNLYMRVIRNGEQVTETAVNITGATQANPCVITAVAHGYSNGDEVYISGILGMTQLNGRNFKVANVTANTFSLLYMDAATNVNSAGFTAYSSAGTAEKIYQITTPYVTADLQEINFTQSADVITLVHPNYAPRELSRTGHTSWTLSAITFNPSISRPTSVSIAVGVVGTSTVRYKVTAVKAETYEESLAGTEAADAITAITNANPAVVSTVGHGCANGDEVLIESVGGMTELNGRTFIIAGVTANSFQLKDTDSTSYGVYSGGGSSFRTAVVSTAAGTPTSANPNVISWTAVTDAIEYNVYKEVFGVYGFVGIAQSTSFSDANITPDDADNPTVSSNLFKLAGDFPSSVSYFQQRRIFANTDNDPEKVFCSRTAQQKNFTTHQPLQDDDAVFFSLSGRQVNEIRHLVDLGAMVVLTTGGEWTIEGDPSGILTPVDINPKQRSYNGSSTLAPIIVNGSALYVQGRGSIIRDLLFNQDVQNYTGNDLTIFSNHLFEGYTLRDWAFQQIPNSIVWVVRSDGTLLGLTYLREHQIFGWHRHDFQGDVVEQVCVVPEGQEDAVYLVIKRTITGLASLGGSTRRYIERLSTRAVDDVADSIFVDSCLSYDGTNSTATTMTLSGGTNWTSDETLTLTASAAFFAASDVGNEIELTGSDGTVIRFIIAAFSSTTVVTGNPHATVPVAMRSVAITIWGKGILTISGLWHLEGESISVLGDAFVAANPNNDAYDVVTIANGSATLDQPYVKIHAGLPYVSDLQTLDIDSTDSETMADKKILITKVTLVVESSRGIWVGGSVPHTTFVGGVEAASDTTLGPTLTELKLRDDEDYDEPTDLVTGPVDVNIQSQWTKGGRIFVRQTDPLPLAVLAAMPSGMIPFRR